MPVTNIHKYCSSVWRSGGLLSCRNALQGVYCASVSSYYFWLIAKCCSQLPFTKQSRYFLLIECLAANLCGWSCCQICASSWGDLNTGLQDMSRTGHESVTVIVCVGCAVLRKHRSDDHVTVHRVKFLTIEPTRWTNFSNLFLEWNSTCFG